MTPDLDGEAELLQAAQRVLVEGVEGLVPHDGGLQDVAAATVEHEQSLVHLHGLVWDGGGTRVNTETDRRSCSPGGSVRSSRPTCSLEVERHQLGAAQPHGKGVIVGGVQALAAGVDPGQLQTVVLQELLALHLVDVLLRLGLRERRHVPETGPLSADLCQRVAPLARANCGSMAKSVSISMDCSSAPCWFWVVLGCSTGSKGR